MKSNSKQVRDAAREYLIGCIMDADPKNWDKDTDDLKTRLEIIIDEFRSAANYPHNLQRIPNDQDRFIDWQKGLPSSLPIDWTDHDIVERMTDWGLPNDNNYPTEKSIKWYYHILYSELTKLFTKHNLEL